MKEFESFSCIEHHKEKKRHKLPDILVLIFIIVTFLYLVFNVEVNTIGSSKELNTIYILNEEVQKKILSERKYEELMFKAETSFVPDNIEVDKVSSMIFSLVNKERTNNKLNTVLKDIELEKAAKYHVENIAFGKSEISHIDKSGNGPYERLANLGIVQEKEMEVNSRMRICSIILENIQVYDISFLGLDGSEDNINQLVAQKVINNWKKSDLHYRALLDEKHCSTGISVYYDRNSKFIYVVGLFRKFD